MLLALRYLWAKIYDFFLVKEIVSREGVVHFRRWRLLTTPWFTIYLHKIAHSDLDIDMHEHPWNFTSLILKGAYSEDAKYPPSFDKVLTTIATPGSIVRHKTTDVHKITILTPAVWTIVLAGKREHVWGYQTANGWVHHKEYNRLRRARKAVEGNETDTEAY